MTSAVGLWKHVKELQDMGADEATIAAVNGLARNAISRAGPAHARQCRRKK
jgi:hypothetical protein